jgi:hypothetical protein
MIALAEIGRQLFANAAIAASRVASSRAAGRSYSLCLHDQSVPGVTESLAGIAVEARPRITWSCHSSKTTRSAKTGLATAAKVPHSTTSSAMGLRRRRVGDFEVEGRDVLGRRLDRER